MRYTIVREPSLVQLPLLKKVFTLPELQAAFEKLLKRKLDKRNFRKSVSRVIRTTNWTFKRQGVKPARLYFYRKDAAKRKLVLFK